MIVHQSFAHRKWLTGRTFSHAIRFKDLVYPVDAISFRMHAVKTVFVADIQTDQNKTGNADTKTEYIEEGIAFLFHKASFENSKIIFVHHKG